MANELNVSDAGSATQPVYFKDGIPVKTTYTLKASVPAGAKFTDTTYSAATQTTEGLMSATDKIKLDNINVAYGICETAAATAQKVVTLIGNTEWKLEEGALIMVKFAESNTAENVTLKVGNSDAYPIWYNTGEYTGTSSAYCGYAARTITYAFNGTHWVWISSSYDANSDTKVQQNAAITTNANYPILLGYNSSTAKVTNVVNKTSTLKYNPSTQTLTVPKISGALTGNASTATAFSAAKSITLSGDVTGTSSSTGGWTISTTLSNTGVAAGSYGLASAVTPAFGASFNVPHITVDAKGRITAASTHTVKLPANPNVDTGATSVAFSGSGNALTGVSYDASNRTLTFTKATYNNYTLPSATNSVRGGVKIGYSQNGKNYPVQLSNEQMFVNVPWTDNNTTYTAGTGLSLSGTKFNHTNSVTARTSGTQSTASPGYGGTFKVTEPLYDAQGHITGVSQATITFPAAQSIPTTLPNPKALKIGSKSYTGSSEITITAADLGVAGAMVYKGTTSTEITDGGTQAPTIGGSSVAVSNLQAGNVVLYGAKEFVWNGSSWELLGDEGSYKVKQTAVSSPSASGNTTSFIDTISQDTNGKITATKKTVTTVTQSAAGLMSAEDKKKLDGIAAGATANTGDITGVTAGNGLTGGGSSGSVTLNVGAGEGISVAADAISLATSGVTAGTYGPSAAVTGNNNATMNVPEITVDAYGRVTKVTNRVYTAKNSTYTSLKNPNSLIVQGNGTQSLTYDGSAAKTLNIKPGTNVSVTSDTNGNITIAATDTKYNIATSSTAGLVKSGTDITVNTSGNVQVDKLTATSLGTDGTTHDVNSLKEYNKFKFWNLSSSGAYTNLPSTMASTGIRVGLQAYPISSSSYVQDITTNASSKKYYRVSNGDTWGDWQAICAIPAGTAIGSATQPVYIQADGTPKATTYTLGKSVPADAKFTDTTSFTITATATDDDVIVLTGTNGTNKVTFDAKHAQKGPSSGYTSGNTVTSISGTGGTIKIPQITVDKYGHVTAAADENITITLPSIPTNHAKVDANNTFTANNTFNGALILGENNYGLVAPESSIAGQLYFVEDDSPSLPSNGALNQILISNGLGEAVWHSIAKASDSNKRYLVNTGSASGLDYIEQVYTQDNVLFGAAWNDYAEFRNQKEVIEPGYCVASSDDGKVYKTSKKFQACDGIVSDTFGFAIGQTDSSKTPLAVAGRVLAYFEGNREDYHAGDTVCAGPNGKICKMTREEICEWPDRIVGIVSEIPLYETWGENNIKVNNRIWVKIK